MTFLDLWALRFLVGFALLTIVYSVRAESSSSGADRVVPRETKVLLLPPVDATVDAIRLHPLRQQIMRLRQQSEFITRQFVVLGESMAARAAAAKPALNLADPKARSPELFAELAKRTAADWVLRLAVTEIASDESDSAVEAKVSVHSTVMIQIWDTRRHRWLDNRTYVGRTIGGGSPPELFIESLDTATEEALSRVLGPYPLTVPVSKNGAIVDYLDGQTAPFVGDPEKTFSGLKPPLSDPP